MDEKTAAVWLKLIATIGRITIVSVISYATFRCIDALAGQQTEALIEASLEYGSTNYFLLAATLVSILWGFAERKSKEKATRDYSKRLQKFEKQMDPERTSSKLHESGATNPKDKL